MMSGLKKKYTRWNQQISELEYIAIEIFQYEIQRKNKTGKIIANFF